MKRSTNGIALEAARSKQIKLANRFFDDGLDLSAIASELNKRMFRQKNGQLFSWVSVSDLIHEKNFEI